MNDASVFLLFDLDGQAYALHLSAVEEVIRAVEVTPLPAMPDIVLGVINIRGRIVPVFNIRKRFRLPERELHLSDHLIVAHTGFRTVAMAVDSAVSVVSLTETKVVDSQDILPHLPHVEGVAKLEGDIILIHNLDGFLSLEEKLALDQTMRRA